jgi:hypothetical protein
MVTKKEMIDNLLEEIKMKPATILKLKIEIDESGYYYELDPERDITAYETILIYKLITVAMNSSTEPSVLWRYVKMNNLQRHFKKTNEIAEQDEEDDEFYSDDV